VTDPKVARNAGRQGRPAPLGARRTPDEHKDIARSHHRKSPRFEGIGTKLRAAVSALLAEPAVPNEDRCDLFAAAGRAAGDLLDDRAQYALTSQWVDAERDRGNAGRPPVALSCLARLDLLAGWMASAEANLAEARSVAAVTATPATAAVVSLGELTVLAWRGRAEEPVRPPLG
jgi:hypothetical protein